MDCYRDFVSGTNAIHYGCEPDIESLRPYMATNTAGGIWTCRMFSAPRNSSRN